MPLFHIAVREHTYTGRFYSDVVQAGSCEEALQVAARHAAVPRPPPGAEPQHGSDVAVTGRTRTGRLDTDIVQPSRREEAAQAAAVPGPPPGPAPQQGFSVVVREQAPAGRAYSDIVQAGSAEEAVQAAAAQAAAPGPPPGPAPRAEAAGRPGCADVWVYALLHCELGAGHDPPHLAIAHGYRRPVRWVRDDLGIAHPVPDPAAGAPVVSPATQPSPAPEAEPAEAPSTGAGSQGGRPARQPGPSRSATAWHQAPGGSGGA